MHEVLFLLFRELFSYISKLLDPDEEKDGFHIGLFPKSFYQPGFQVSTIASAGHLARFACGKGTTNVCVRIVIG